jgi:integrase
LTVAEIESVLKAIDRQTAKGKRDYAMTLLLSVYGLRGIEVVRLRLDDIDWREHKLTIGPRKAGNRTTYPLTVPVGEAILTYLRNGRPESSHRQVFLSAVAPFGPLVRITQLIQQYMARASVRVARPGSHTFRYSCAQRLFEEGLSLKEIGDCLGHARPESTQRYTKIAIEQLRAVASGDGEDLL